MEEPVVAIDLGGTSIKAAVAQGADLLAVDSIPANSREGLAPQLPRIASLIECVCERARLKTGECQAIGIVVPFLVDPVEQRIRSAPREKYGDACGVDLRGWARERFDLELKLENDAHAALLGEWKYGAGRGSEDFVMITLGTGIGCSVLMRGHALRGKHFQAGVLGGHFIANAEHGSGCNGCPSAGCYEAESAMQSLEREAKRRPEFRESVLAAAKTIDFAAVFEAAARGDAVGVSVRDRCLAYWQALAITLVHAYDPDRIVIGGGVSEGPHARAFLPGIQDYVNRHAWIVEPVEIRAAELGNKAGLAGITTLFSSNLQCI